MNSQYIEIQFTWFCCNDMGLVIGDKTLTHFVDNSFVSLSRGESDVGRAARCHQGYRFLVHGVLRESL